MNKLFTSTIDDAHGLRITFIGVLFWLALCAPASNADQFASDEQRARGAADAFNYDGTVTEANSFLGQLVPVGSDLSGIMSIESSPNGMTTNTQDFLGALLGLRNSQGNTLFCFDYNYPCLPGEVSVPIVSIDAINLNFDASGCPNGGSLQLTSHSNTFGFDMVMSFNLNTDTFTFTADGLGSFTGTGMILGCDADTDADDVPDHADNCTLIANPDQRDTNNDGYGNACDPDLDNNNIVNFGDISLWVPFFNIPSTGDQDFNGDGSSNFGDYALFPAYFQQPPGPSGVAP